MSDASRYAGASAGVVGCAGTLVLRALLSAPYAGVKVTFLNGKSETHGWRGPQLLIADRGGLGGPSQPVLGVCSFRS
jgi:hypothetical protein